MSKSTKLKQTRLDAPVTLAKSKPLTSFINVELEHIEVLESRLKSKSTIVLIHAKWCGHCVQFQPVWAKFASYLAKSKFVDDVQLLAIESDVLRELKHKKESLYNLLLTGSASNEPDNIYFPKLMVFKKVGNKLVPSEYNDDRSLRALKKYVESTFSTATTGGTKTSVRRSVKLNQLSDKDGRGLNEQIHGTSKKSLSYMIDKMIAKYLGL